MTKVRIALARTNLGSLHSMRRISFFHNPFFRNRLGETGPSCTAIEFILRAEERLASDKIDINSGLVIVPIGILKCSLGAEFTRHAVLVFGKLSSQLCVTGNCFRRIHLLVLFLLALSITKQNRADNHNNGPKQTEPQGFVRRSLRSEEHTSELQSPDHLV